VRLGAHDNSFSIGDLGKKSRAFISPKPLPALCPVHFSPRRSASWLACTDKVLGRLFTSWRDFCSKLTYLADSNPTLSGPELNVTIIPDCSGLNGVELFDYLFARWRSGLESLSKRPSSVGYFAGLLACSLANAIRITSFVALGNQRLRRKRLAIPYFPQAGSFSLPFFSSICR